MSSDQRAGVEDEIVREFGDGIDVDQIARRHNMSSSSVYELINRAVGPVPPPLHVSAAANPWAHDPAAMPAAVAVVRMPLASPFAVASLVFGVIGVLGGFCLLGIPCVVAVVCGHVGLNQTRQGTRSGHAMAVAGLILGYLFVIPAIIAFIMILTGSLGSAITHIRDAT